MRNIFAPPPLHTHTHNSISQQNKPCALLDKLGDTIHKKIEVWWKEWTPNYVRTCNNVSNGDDLKDVIFQKRLFWNKCLYMNVFFPPPPPQQKLGILRLLQNIQFLYSNHRKRLHSFKIHCFRYLTIFIIYLYC